MPKRGQFRALDPKLHPSKAKLASKLRELFLRSTLPSCRALSKALCYSESMTSQWMSGRRVPKPRELENLLSCLLKHCPTAFPGALEDMLKLRDLAAADHCRCCSAYEAPVPLIKPADLTSAPDWRSSALPVPPAEGDRQRKSETAQTTTTADNDLISRLERGRHADVRFVLIDAGRNLPVFDVIRTVDYLRSGNQDEAAEAVLHHAGHRAAGDIYELALLLNSARRADDVESLLRAASKA
ncbi:hypothetical protein [Nonomuraea typhae]|uniref:XRE family transcriptional regulator n=1 Tax=Nonomuraea typhae TaxID=2603600 RepID=A0ABW7ZA53_9ACTN